ncbi:NTP transferase domain-containing protein [Chitinimonas sp. BJYL2]|uniref:nucleotidyltransferase family protein n=1 Tax=Chitinimonas sp. BJYL2 TaxID=2976696 RepID=UPI0022B2D785|nr:nucleotidyltransferase family protein [Chitinimonas sp. BJYL2]
MMPVGLLLAAGRGQRFDPSGVQHKLLQTLPDGRRVAEAAADTLLAAVPQVLALLPANHNPHTDALRAVLASRGCIVLGCADAHLGMGHTLAAGVAASAEAPGWLVLLADMPWVQFTTVCAVRDALRERDALVQPVHAGQPGHPVGFPPRYRDALLALQGDRGAKAVLAGQSVWQVETADTGVLRDVDTAADLRPAVSAGPQALRLD